MPLSQAITRLDTSAPAFPLSMEGGRHIDWSQLSLIRRTAAVLPTFHHDCTTHLRRGNALNR